MNDLGALISTALERRGESIRAFAERFGKSYGYVARVVRGAQQSHASTIYKIAKDDAPAWADALGLEGLERARFLELVWLSHSPPEIGQLLDSLRRQLAESRENGVKSNQKLALICEHLARRGIKLPQGI